MSVRDWLRIAGLPRPLKLLTGAIFLTFFLLVIVSGYVWRSYGEFERRVELDYQLDEVSRRITYYNRKVELYRSLSVNALDEDWWPAYESSVQELNSLFREASSYVPGLYVRAGAVQMDSANVGRMRDERKALELAKEGNTAGADSIFESDEYRGYLSQYYEGQLRFSMTPHPELRLARLKLEFSLLDELMSSQAQVGVTTGGDDRGDAYQQLRTAWETVKSELMVAAPELRSNSAFLNFERVRDNVTSLETEAIEACNEGRCDEARALLGSAPYVDARARLNQAKWEFSKVVEDRIDGYLHHQRYEKVYFLALMVAIALLIIAVWWGVLRQLARHYAERQEAMHTLRENEAKTRALIQALPDTMFLIDRKGCFLDYHARGEAGLAAAAHFIGQNVNDAMPAHIARNTMDAVERTLHSGLPQRFNYELVNENAKQFFEARVVPCGEYRALAIVRNITEREQAEQTIREAEAKFRILVEQSLTGIYIVQKGRFKYVNPRFAEIFGYEADEILSFESIADVVAPEDRHMVMQEIEGESAHYTLRGLTGDGGVIFVEIYASNTEYDGEPAVIGTIVDVTERREAQEKLRVLGMAVEQSAEGVFVMDTGGSVRFVNPAWARMHGYEVDEVTGEHFRIFHTEEQMRREVFPVINRFEQTSVCRAEMGHKRKDGSTFASSTAFASLRDADGVVIGAVGICRDITEQKRYEAELLAAKERAEEMSRMKSAFLTNMSHEIRTPLTGIIGFATVLEEEVPDSHREFAQLIRQSGDRLMQTLNAILELARLEAGEMMMAPREINLREEVEQVARFFKGMADKKSLDLDVAFEGPLHAVHADPNVLTMILNNLIGNAIKFTDEGRVSVGVAACDGHVTIEVSDTGVGIESKFLPYLFDEFKQESDGLTRSHEGSGLGLSITRRLVHLMKGQIDVESEKGHGSIFRVCFPSTSEPIAEPLHVA